jgi:hypothetical protein
MKCLKNIQGCVCRVVFALLAILLLTSNLVYAQRTVGVQVGDWGDYTVTGAFQGDVDDPFENVATMRVTVVDIVDTNVTVEAHLYFENGSDTFQYGWVDIETGDGTHQGWLIAANLYAGDRVYTSNQTMFGELAINETVTREYLGSMVEVNHFKINVTSPPNPFYNMSMLMDWCWYRDSGIVAEMRMYTMVETMGNTTMVDVNVDVFAIIPEFPVFTYLPLFIIMTITVVLLAKFNSKRLRSTYSKGRIATV